MRLFLLVSLLLVMVVACGTSSPAYKTSAKQAASIEARHAGSIRQAIAFEGSCNGIECLYAVNILSRWGKISDQAIALSADLKAAQPVEPEVATLTNETITAADRISTSYKVFRDCAYRAGSVEHCGNEENGAESAWRAMPQVLDGWKPYGGG